MMTRTPKLEQNRAHNRIVIETRAETKTGMKIRMRTILKMYPLSTKATASYWYLTRGHYLANDHV